MRLEGADQILHAPSVVGPRERRTDGRDPEEVGRRKELEHRKRADDLSGADEF